MKKYQRYDKKKIVIAIILVIVVLALALLLVVKSCESKTEDVESTELADTSTNENETLFSASIQTETETETEIESTATQSGKKADDVITTSSFDSLTGSKANLVDKGDYYELAVNVNEKNSKGDIYTTGKDTIKISKNAQIKWYVSSTFTDTITLVEYLSMTDVVRINYTDFNGNVIYAKDSNGYIVSFFDGIFS